MNFEIRTAVTARFGLNLDYLLTAKQRIDSNKAITLGQVGFTGGIGITALDDFELPFAAVNPEPYASPHWAHTMGCRDQRFYRMSLPA